MADDRSKIDYAKSYLRRQYPQRDSAGALNSGSLAALKQLATRVFGEATDTVTLTNVASEGGTASGQVTFEKVLLGMAIEELLGVYEPAEQEPSRMLIPDYRYATPV